MIGSTGALVGGAGSSQARHPNKPRRTTANGFPVTQMGHLAGAARVGTSPCGTVPRRAGGDAHAAGLAGRARSPAALGRLVPGTVAADSGSSIRERASRCQRRTPTSRRARAARCSSCTPLDSQLAASAPASSRCGSGPPRSGPSAPPPSQRLAVARHSLTVSGGARPPAPAPLRAGRLRPAGGRARRLLGRRGAEQPRLARPARRPGPPRDPADAPRKRDAPRISHTRSPQASASCGASPSRPSQSTLALEQARPQRASYLATLASRRRLNAAEISS